MSVSPGHFNFKIYQGATFRTMFTLNQGTLSSSEPWDLTGSTAELVVKSAPLGNVLLTLTDGDGITLGGTAGTIEIIIDDAVTAALSWRVGQYELFITDPSGDKDLFLTGAFTVIPF
jgi:hypothetical protein